MNSLFLIFLDLKPVVMSGNSEGLLGLCVFGNKWRNIQLIVSSEPQWVSCVLRIHKVLAFF